MDTYELLKTVHVLAAVIWVGGAATIQILAIRAQRVMTTDPEAVMRLGKESEAVGMKVFFPASLVVLAAGIGMVLDSGIDFQDLWIVLGLVGIVISAVTGATFLGPESGRIGKLMEERGGLDEEISGRIKRIFLVSRIELTILLLIVINMVVKPGA